MWNLAWYSFKNYLHCPKIHIFLRGWDFYRVRWKADSVCLRDCFSQGSAPVLARPGQQNCQSSEAKCRAMKSISSNILHFNTHHWASMQLAPWVLESTNFPAQVIRTGTAIELYLVRNPISQKKFWWGADRGSKWTSQEEASQVWLWFCWMNRLINFQQL